MLVAVDVRDVRGYRSIGSGNRHCVFLGAGEHPVEVLIPENGVAGAAQEHFVVPHLGLEVGRGDVEHTEVGASQRGVNGEGLDEHLVAQGGFGFEDELTTKPLGKALVFDLGVGGSGNRVQRGLAYGDERGHVRGDGRVEAEAAPKLGQEARILAQQLLPG